MLLMAENIDDPELTLAEVAANLRVSEDTARRLVLGGVIPARKQGRYWRVAKSDVEAYKRREREKRPRNTDKMNAIRLDVQPERN